MMWLDFFLQALVGALAWLAALTLWAGVVALIVHVGLWVACRWPFDGADPEDYS